MIETALGYLKMNDVEYEENRDMASLTTIRIGGVARIVAYPREVSELSSLVSFLESYKIKYKTVGRMSNILPTDELYNGVLIKTSNFRGISLKNGVLSLGAGEALPRVAARLCELSLEGFEELSGIPGSVGASLLGNAGAYGRALSDLFVGAVCLIKESGEIYRFSQAEVDFSYRYSTLKESELIILSVELKPTFGDILQIKERMSEYAKRRRLTQPREPSLGSVFKRPVSGYASKMIDECDLRGYRIGGAEISSKHAGFIVNKGNARAKEVKRLVELSRESVYKKFGVKLEREIEYL